MVESMGTPPARYGSIKDVPFGELVRNACQKNSQAFGALYERYKEPIIRRLTLLVSDRETALDLCQETFVRAWQSVSPDIASRFERWLYKIAYHLAIDYLRHKRRIMFLPLPEDGQDGPTDYGQSLHQEVTGQEDRIVAFLFLQEAFAAMSPQYRVCMQLKFQEKYTIWEIAQTLDISEKAVSANISRGYTQLRKIYTHMMGDGHETSKGGNKRNDRINI